MNRVRVYEIDENGFYTGNWMFIADNDEIPDGFVDGIMPDGLFKAKWTGSEWVEDMPPEQIDELKNRPQPPSEQERIEALEQALIDLMMEGGM